DHSQRRRRGGRCRFWPGPGSIRGLRSSEPAARRLRNGACTRGGGPPAKPGRRPPRLPGRPAVRSRFSIIGGAGQKSVQSAEESQMKKVVMALAGLLIVSACGGSPAPSTPSTLGKVDSIANKVPADLKALGTLQIASDATYEPNEFVDPSSGAITGWDV